MTFRSGDLVRRKDPTQDQQEMLITQMVGPVAYCAWYDAKNDYHFGDFQADQLVTSVEASKRAKVMQERAQARDEAAKADADARKAEWEAAEAARLEAEAKAESAE
jgi:uncharacterized protein YodC (DUF2158 family)